MVITRQRVNSLVVCFVFSMFPLMLMKWASGPFFWPMVGGYILGMVALTIILKVLIQMRGIN